MKLLKINKLRYVELYEYSGEENDENLCGNKVSVSRHVKDRKNFGYKKPKISLNQSLCPYYRMLYVSVKELARESLIDSF